VFDDCRNVFVKQLERADAKSHQAEAFQEFEDCDEP
jgi:hypothetical protein